MACSAARPDTRLSDARSSKLIACPKYNATLTNPKAIQRTMMKVEALSPPRELIRSLDEGRRRKKSQIPNPKSQTNSRSQIPKCREERLCSWSLGFGAFLGFGIWDLELFIVTLQQFAFGSSCFEKPAE